MSARIRCRNARLQRPALTGGPQSFQEPHMPKRKGCKPRPKGMVPLFLPPSLYDAAEKEGLDMRVFCRVAPIPQLRPKG